MTQYGTLTNQSHWTQMNVLSELLDLPKNKAKRGTQIYDDYQLKKGEVDLLKRAGYQHLLGRSVVSQTVDLTEHVYGRSVKKKNPLSGFFNRYCFCRVRGGPGISPDLTKEGWELIVRFEKREKKVATTSFIQKDLQQRGTNGKEEHLAKWIATLDLGASPVNQDVRGAPDGREENDGSV
ncbi:MAG: hypothetical protein S4CHLAM45_02520 [Chlamydiales bacterium]|nr:hypothetical protein [Chlamydiales bacterium]MCH9619111.1 hypothetical protein [Chlamydiales bacterium]MCH9622373.1 hypothetical protein [Chlamydiales bacterium]